MIGMEDLYLIHHGIKGQKWGVRRYQNEDGTLTSAGKMRYLENSDSVNSNKPENEQKKQLSEEDKQKLKTALIVGGSIVAAAALAYGGYKLYQNYNFDDGSPIDPLTGLKLRKDGPMPPAMTDNDLKDFNPFMSKMAKKIGISIGPKEYISGSSTNCALNTIAYDFNRRGYNVKPGFTTRGFDMDTLLKRIYPDYSPKNSITLNLNGNDGKMASDAILSERFESLFKDMPDGSRGYFGAWWKYGSGHAMAWEKIDGKTLIKDCQIGKVYEPSEWMKTHASFLRADLAPRIARTDNLKVNARHISNVGKSRYTEDLYFSDPNNTKVLVKHGANAIFNLLKSPVGIAAQGTAAYLAISSKNKKNSSKAKQLQKQGKTYSEIAKELGVSESYVGKLLDK